MNDSEKPVEPPKKRYRSPFPKDLSSCIDHLTRPVFKSRGLASTKLIAEWPKVVGPELARRSMPEKLSFPQGKTTDGTLTIAVQNGFATEMQHIQPLILERLSTYFGYRAVSRIMISHTFVPAAAPAPVIAAPKAVLPQGSAQMVDMDSIEDEELRNALRSFAGALEGK